jgi:hypothetical protein
MPKSAVSVTVKFVKNLQVLATPVPGVENGATGFEISWTEVENASGYKYRVTANGETGEWETATATTVEIPYADYPTGTVNLTVEVFAVGDLTQYGNSEVASLDGMQSVDPTFTYLPKDALIYGAEYYFNITSTQEDQYGLKKAESEGNTVIWKATLIGTELRSTNAAQWAVQAGDTIDYDNAALGYTDGVLTPETLPVSLVGPYVWANNALRIEYTATNAFGRTVTCSHTIVVNQSQATELKDVYGQDRISNVIGGEVTSIENTISPILGSGNIYKLSNNGNYNYVDGRSYRYNNAPNLQTKTFHFTSDSEMPNLCGKAASGHRKVKVEKLS